MYCTILEVRNDTMLNLSDSVIFSKIRQAESKINGVINYNYVLPLPFYHQNNLTILGTATGTGTITLSLGTNIFNVDVITGDTNIIISTKIKNEIWNSNLYNIDYFDNNIIYIINKQNNSLQNQSNITLTYTTQFGISITEKTEERHNPVINQIARNLVALYLYQDNYSIEAQGTNKDYREKEVIVENQLSQLIKDREKMGFVALTDEYTGEPFTQNNKSKISYSKTESNFYFDLSTQL